MPVRPRLGDGPLDFRHVLGQMEDVLGALLREAGAFEQRRFGVVAVQQGARVEHVPIELGIGGHLLATCSSCSGEGLPASSPKSAPRAPWL